MAVVRTWDPDPLKGRTPDWWWAIPRGDLAGILLEPCEPLPAERVHVADAIAERYGYSDPLATHAWSVT